MATPHERALKRIPVKDNNSGRLEHLAKTTKRGVTLMGKGQGGVSHSTHPVDMEVRRRQGKELYRNY